MYYPLTIIFFLSKYQLFIFICLRVKINKMHILSQGLILLFLINRTVAQVAPTWITSSYVQAASKKVIDGVACSCKTGNTSTPTATLTFVTAFSAVPNLGYGITNYQGKYEVT